MLSDILNFFKKHLPKKLFLRLRKVYYFLIRNFHPRISETEFREIVTNKLGVKKGSVVFIHSSVDNMFLDFPFYDLLPILKEIVGQEGTLLFPSSHFNIRAEEYLKNPDAVFDVKRSVTVRGLLPEMARMDEHAVRSLHPTNSVVVIGKHAEELICDHHNTIYPCGEKSPFYEMIKFGGLIVGLGVGIENLSFAHVVEDVMKEEFPYRTRKEEIYECKVIDKEGNTRIIKTLVASPEIKHRNGPRFIDKHVPPDICRVFTYKGVRFFTADAAKLFDKMVLLAKEGKTIYSW